MKIRKLTASFGKLQNESLRFHDGLNLIYAPNESGKSTWCAFIRAMLYGVDSAERARAGFLPDKLRYTPWSGAPMEGSMELTSDHSDITILRSTTARSAPMRDFTAVYTGTNIPVEGMNGQNCGELLTGVTKDIFRRSAFIEQGAVAISGSPELEKRIQSIVSSGEEQTSYSEAEERLNRWQRKRRYHRRGMLPEMETKMDEAQRLLDDMGTSVGTVQELEKKLDSKQKECAELELAVTDARRRQRTNALSQLRSGRARLDEQSELHDHALEELSHSREALRNSDFGTYSFEQLEQEVAKDRETLLDLEDGRSSTRNLIPAVLFSVLAILSAAFYGILTKIPLIAAAGIFCVSAVFFFVRYSGIRQVVHQASETRNAILRKYKISLPDDLDQILLKHRSLVDAVSQAEEKEKQTREELAAAGRMLHTLEENAVSELDFASGNSEAAKLSRALQASRKEASELSAQIAGIKGRLSAMGDPMVLASSLSSMKEEYELVQKEYDAITLAEELLRESDQEIQSRFSPELSRIAAQYMQQMTGGRYEDVQIGLDFSAQTRTQEDTVARDAEYLSAGTMDLMYLAVRLAVCELALPDSEPCPLIIDDALVNLDNTRLSQAMTLLRKLALDRQIILFTCRQIDATPSLQEGDAEE